jgi:ABC-2 type transport system permease protein
MLPAIRAEFRKLLTVRSTYIWTAVALALVTFVSFWVTGYKGGMPTTDLLNGAAGDAASIVPMFLAVIAVLLITHEYRYNTIMYTLTASNSRSKVLLAKLCVLLVYGTIATLTSMVLGALAAWIGVLVAGHSLPVQYLYIWDTLWHGLFYVLAWIVTGLILGVLLRHVVGAIVTIFLFPSTVEQLLSLILKENSKYLPFTSLQYVVGGSPVLSPGRAALVFTAYIVVVGGIAWYLFVRRDATA